MKRVLSLVILISSPAFAFDIINTGTKVITDFTIEATDISNLKRALQQPNACKAFGESFTQFAKDTVTLLNDVDKLSTQIGIGSIYSQSAVKSLKSGLAVLSFADGKTLFAPNSKFTVTLSDGSTKTLEVGNYIAQIKQYAPLARIILQQIASNLKNQADSYVGKKLGIASLAAKLEHLDKDLVKLSIILEDCEENKPLSAEDLNLEDL